MMVGRRVEYEWLGGTGNTGTIIEVYENGKKLLIECDQDKLKYPVAKNKVKPL